ncbi:unnamed protein product, partial [Ascophyllum nodosum]
PILGKRVTLTTISLRANLCVVYAPFERKTWEHYRTSAFLFCSGRPCDGLDESQDRYRSRFRQSPSGGLSRVPSKLEEGTSLSPFPSRDCFPAWFLCCKRCKRVWAGTITSVSVVSGQAPFTLLF